MHLGYCKYVELGKETNPVRSAEKWPGKGRF